MKRALPWGLLVLLTLSLGACATKAGHDDHEGHDEHEDHDEHKGEGDHDEHKGEDDEHDEHKGEDGHDEHEDVVRLSEDALTRSGVELGTVGSGVLESSVVVPAEVHLNPDRVAHISPLVEGQLLSVDVTLGDKVAAGQELARLRSVELGQARAELSRTTSLRSVAHKTLKRQERLRAEGINSERNRLEAKLAFDQANAEREAARSRLQVFGLKGGAGPDMTLISPIEGLVVERHATRGENVAPSDTLFVVADLGRVWVLGRAYEQQISRIGVGMEASLTLNAYPGRTWTGKVDYVGAMINEETRTLPVRVEIENKDGMLRPGLFGSMHLSATADTAAALPLVPVSALQTLEGKSVVFVPGEEAGTFEARPVTIGREDQGRAEVQAGLKPGDKIVVKGAFVLKSELVRGSLGHGHAH